jgi:hypothetical protein
MEIFDRSRHISQDALGLHAMNDLPATGEDMINDHLSYCVRCRHEFSEVQAFIRIFRSAAKVFNRLN